MDELRFDGRVAIVTGAGRAIGREEALLLARRGASVVVNDLGGEPDGTGQATEPASEVVEEIIAGGGIAVSSFASVATDEGAASIVQTAIDAFGRVDIVVNNAGIVVAAPIEQHETEDFDRVLGVHAGGTFRVCRAAWPHLMERGYGRIVNTGSSSLFGYGGLSGYTAGKGGIFGLSRGLAKEGKARGISVNCVFPGALSRLTFNPMTTDEERRHLDTLSPHLVAPVVAFLAHESCTLTGETLTALGGAVSRVFVGNTAGFSSPDLTPEDVLGHIDEIFSADNFRIETGTGSWVDE